MKCPNCNKENRAGLLLCEHCGHQLITLSELSRFKTGRFDTIELPWKPYTASEPEVKPTRVTPPLANYVTLDLVDAEERIRLRTQGHISLGRADKDSEWQPTVDLTPYGAVERGVSRMHADLFFENDNVFVLELGSANGTRVNGIRVNMGLAQQLYDGDELELGRLRIRVSFSM